jgi:transposase
MEVNKIGWKEKHRLYYDKVIDMHINYGMGYQKISHIVPVSKSGICKWIINFESERGNKYPKDMKQAKQEPVEKSTSEVTDNKTIQDKIASLERQLRKEKLQADAYDTMIDIAEKKFNIPIRKKAGAKQ